MKKLLTLFTICAVAFMLPPCITDAQTVTKFSYHYIEVYYYDKINRQSMLVGDYHLDGIIIIS